MFIGFLHILHTNWTNFELPVANGHIHTYTHTYQKKNLVKNIWRQCTTHENMLKLPKIVWRFFVAVLIYSRCIFLLLVGSFSQWAFKRMNLVQIMRRKKYVIMLILVYKSGKKKKLKMLWVFFLSSLQSKCLWSNFAKAYFLWLGNGWKMCKWCVPIRKSKQLYWKWNMRVFPLFPLRSIVNGA